MTRPSPPSFFFTLRRRIEVRTALLVVEYDGCAFSYASSDSTDGRIFSLFSFLSEYADTTPGLLCAVDRSRYYPPPAEMKDADKVSPVSTPSLVLVSMNRSPRSLWRAVIFKPFAFSFFPLQGGRFAPPPLEV